MKLMILMPELFWGGAERQFRFVIEKLNSQNVQTYVCVPSYYSLSRNYKKNDEKRFVDLNPNIEFIINENNKIGKLETIFYYMINALKLKIKYGVNCAVVYDAKASYIIPFLRMIGIKVLYSERNSGDFLKNPILNMFIRLSNVITANSLSASKRIEEAYKRDVYYIKNGTQVKKTNKQLRIGVKFEEAKILIPARVVPVKNQKIILKFLVQNKKYKGDIIFAGKIEDEEYKRKLDEYIEKNSLIKRIKFLGYVDQMEEVYEQADVVILPSYSEGMSNVILECFSKRIPIIVSDIEMNTFTKNLKELSFNPNSVSSLIDIYNRFIMFDENQLNKMLDENLKYIKDNHSVEKMSKKYIELMKKMISNK